MSAVKENEFQSSLDAVISHISTRQESLDEIPILPTAQSITSSISSLPISLPEKGLGTSETTDYLIKEVLPGILQAQNGPRYYGFVVGGVTPAAQLADMLATSYDENVQVNLHQQTASTAIEQRALELVLDLLDIKRSVFVGRTITTGATACNILGLACARDHLLSQSPHLPHNYSWARDGPPSAPGLPSPPLVILSLHPHFSIAKAAALVGLGSGPKIIQQIPADPEDELAFDLGELEERLKAEKEVGRGVIVVYGVGEVNTGGFGRDLDKVAQLCKRYGGWLHVDAAFGGFAGLMPELKAYTQDMDKADSLTLDGHKWLNIPYDCGLFYTRHTESLTNIFQPPSASAPAYLASNATTTDPLSGGDSPEGTVSAGDVPSPLFVNIENSRRFRALPLLASLLSLGKEGYRDIITRNIHFARSIAKYIAESPSYDLLNPSPPHIKDHLKEAIIPSNIVLFRPSADSPYPPSDPTSSIRLTKKINDSRRLYVSATSWRGQSAIRIAVSNYLTEEKRDSKIVLDVLERVGKGEDVAYEN
ncbi:uncharacterized protein I303_101718 [Kwoniella dejecticola CBS 10117]|uniref:PLP-dependent transferase n=1 Tax=Kwoniella dejecticola CBS 10117 TaxID=1296121 RepID=A0A1A6ACZ7_9TREE|nr:uncharacterized protein I303_02146 [Kwoniella dejecticola CBS 10117]OBR87930.1 hypothetical protein I303_02146 [Kwoniella dejecticola CBS 10117]